jgi:hypothetical protein
VLVDQIAAYLWRGARIQRVEAGLFTHLIASEQVTVAQADAKKHTHSKGGVLDGLAAQADYLWGKPVIDDEAAHRRSLAAAAEAAAVRDGPFAAVGRAFLEDARSADALSRLCRYETALDRRLFQRLHELQRMQAARLGPDVPPAGTIDISAT